MILSARTVFLLGYLATPTAASSQATDSAGLRGLDSIGFVELQHTVNTRAEIRVWTGTGRFSLRQPQLDHSWLTSLSSATGTIRDSLALFDIRAIEVSKTKAGLFAVGGAATIGGLGFVVSTLSELGSDCFAPFGVCNTVDQRKVLRITIVSAVGGAILGAVLGAHTKGWKVAYVAP